MLQRTVRRFSASALVSTEVRALQALMRAQGHLPCESTSRAGLHPLVVPLANTESGEVLGLVRWPAQDGGLTIVRTRSQAGHADVDVTSLSLQPCGSPAQFARRAAVEADMATEDKLSASIMSAATEATIEAGGEPYVAGEFASTRLGANQFMLMRVGPFADVWESIARGQMEKGDETAALVAAERASSLNPGWGRCVYLQSVLMGSLGRSEEQRDLALSALEAPFWTLGSPLREVLGAAQLSHVEDLRGLVRAMEDKVREQQNAPPRTAEELAFLRALDALDEVVRTEGLWDDARPVVAAELRKAGLHDAAAIADA